MRWRTSYAAVIYAAFNINPSYFDRLVAKLANPV